eukprot:COSAG04_NODE_360_length_15920_cov_50.432815_13_plen_1375_part_00
MLSATLQDLEGWIGRLKDALEGMEALLGVVVFVVGTVIVPVLACCCKWCCKKQHEDLARLTRTRSTFFRRVCPCFQDAASSQDEIHSAGSARTASQTSERSAFASLRFDGIVPEEAKKLQAALAKKHVSLEMVDMTGGEDVDEVVIDRIEHCSTFIVFGTKHYGQDTGNPASTYNESKFAQSLKKRIILIRMIDVGEQFDQPQARFMFGLNKLEYRWLLGTPMPATLPGNVFAAMKIPEIIEADPKEDSRLDESAEALAGSGKSSEPEPAADAPTESQALEAKLRTMKFSALSPRALAAGASTAEVDAARDDAAPKEALIALIVSRETAAAEKLRSELKDLGLSALIRRAQAAGVEKAALDNAQDDDAPKAAVVDLILEAETGEKPRKLCDKMRARLRGRPGDVSQTSDEALCWRLCPCFSNGRRPVTKSPYAAVDSSVELASVDDDEDEAGDDDLDALLSEALASDDTEAKSTRRPSQHLGAQREKRQDSEYGPIASSEMSVEESDTELPGVEAPHTEDPRQWFLAGGTMCVCVALAVYLILGCGNGFDCGPHGTCTGFFSTQCECKDNHAGSRCDGSCRHGDSNGRTCECRFDYIGELCDTHCSCGLHGTQTGIDAARAAGSCGAGTCACRDGFYGSVCDSRDPCHDIHCGVHGSCRNGRCSCSAGYSGPQCETADPCEGPHRVNCGAGSCQSRGGGDWTCHCYDGYSGLRCQNRDACFSVHCGAHGSCQNGWCLCRDGYSGSRCETPPDPCSDVHCGAHGSCRSGLCDCSDGYSGSGCETPDPCHNVHCGAHGTCVPGAWFGHSCVCVNCGLHGRCDSGSCVCDDGYDGNSCENNIDDCEAAPCLNGGVCTDAVASYSCACSGTGFVGTTCSDDEDECATAADNDCAAMGATCTNTAGGFSCACDPGYLGDGRTCTRDPCHGVNCGEHGNCNGGVCSCHGGRIGPACDRWPTLAECRRSAGSHYVEQEGYLWRTLDGAAAAGTHVGPPNHGCQCDNGVASCPSNWLSPPSGWMLAPHDQTSIAAVAAHRWSTACVALADGTAWCSAHYTSSAGQTCGVPRNDNVLVTCEAGTVTAGVRNDGSLHSLVGQTCPTSDETSYTVGDCTFRALLRCGPHDPCDGINCGEHGSCSAGTCSCRDGYSGARCERCSVVAQVPMSLAECRASVPDHNYRQRGDYIYRTLDGAGTEGGRGAAPNGGCQCIAGWVNGRHDNCPDNWLPLADGWSLAPNDEESKAVIRQHGWSTDCLVLADGTSWFSSNLAGTEYAPGSRCTTHGVPTRDGPHATRLATCEAGTVSTGWNGLEGRTVVGDTCPGSEPEPTGRFSPEPEPTPCRTYAVTNCARRVLTRCGPGPEQFFPAPMPAPAPPPPSGWG